MAITKARALRARNRDAYDSGHMHGAHIYVRSKDIGSAVRSRVVFISLLIAIDHADLIQNNC